MHKFSIRTFLLQVVDISKKISDIPEWFCGCQLNYAENLLKHPDGDKVALIACGMHARIGTNI